MNHSCPTTLSPPTKAPPPWKSIALLILLSLPPLQAATTVSRSEQITIHGAEARQRSALQFTASETLAELHGLLRLRAEPTYPLVLQIKPSTARPPHKQPFTPQIYALPTGWRFQLELYPTELGKRRTLREGLLELYLLEIALRHSSAHTRAQLENAPLQPIPHWIVVGCSQLLEWKEEEREANTLRALLKAKKTIPLSDLLTLREFPPDALTQELFRGGAAALLQALWNQPEGRIQFIRYLSAEITAPHASLTHLQTHFPTLAATPEKLEKWWALHIAALSQPSLPEPFTWEKTERLWLAALRVPLLDEELIALDLSQPHRHPTKKERKQSLPIVVTRLRALQRRAFPTALPLLEETIHIVEKMQKKRRTRKALHRLQTLSENRAAMGQLLRDTEDYLHWVIANNPTSSSAPHPAISHPLSIPPRRDPVTDYLDAMERSLATP